MKLLQMLALMLGLSLLLTACPDQTKPAPTLDLTITAITASANPTTLNSATTSSLSATVSGTGAFDPGVNWSVISGGGALSANTGSSVTYTAPSVTADTSVQIKAEAAGNYSIFKTLQLTVKASTPPAVGDTVIPDTTKVSDPATRALLTAYDPSSGQMRFSQPTPILAALKPGDVLVSEPSSAAPYGYLRKVVSSRTEGGVVVLETAQAKLTDAVSKGVLDAKFDLTAKNLKSSSALLPGVSFSTNAVSPQPRAGIGENYNFKLKFNKVFVPFDSPNASGQITVDGLVEFNAGYGVHVGISGCFEIPPVCVDSVEAKIGFDQAASLHISGDLKGQVSKEIQVGSQLFDPIVFFIGPVPVVLVPKVDLYLSVGGQLEAKFDFQAAESAVAQLGARWTPDDGWKNISNFNFDVSAPKPSVSGNLKPRATTRSTASMTLYGVAGPEVSLIGGLELEGQIPGNPTWIVRGFLKGTVGFRVELPILGTLSDYQATLFDTGREFSRSGNTAPKITLTANALPSPLAFPRDAPPQVYLGLPASFASGCGLFAGFYFNIYDLEDSCGVTSTVVSDVDGPLPAQYIFKTEGVRVITVTARDSQGLTDVKTFRLRAYNPRPDVLLERTGDPQQGENYAISANISDPNESDLKLLCTNATWSVDAPDTVTGPSGCLQQVKFGTTGSREVRVSTRDSYGAVGVAKLTLNVLPPPENPFPRIVNSGVYSREFGGGAGSLRSCSDVAVSSGSTIDLSQEGCTFSILGTPPPRYSAAVTVETPTAEALTYDWKLLITDVNGTYNPYVGAAPNKPTFVLANFGNDPANPVTNVCEVRLMVNAPDPTRSKGPFSVWKGKCTYSGNAIR